MKTRQLAICPNCKQKRQIELEVYLVGHFNPTRQTVFISEILEGSSVRCATCQNTIELSRHEVRLLEIQALAKINGI